MKILAIDTAGPVLGVALCRDGTIVALEEVDRGFRHVEELTPRVVDLLTQNDWSVKTVDAIGVSAGPGSFTGLRVGMATAKGFAWARGIPIYSISTLEALAEQERRYLARRSEEVKWIVPILDARKDRVYAALFTSDGTRATEDLDLPIEEVVGRIPHASRTGGWIAVGALAGDLAAGYTSAASFAPERSAAVGVSLVATRLIAEGQEPDGPYAGPSYLRSGDIGARKNDLTFDQTSQAAESTHSKNQDLS